MPEENSANNTEECLTLHLHTFSELSLTSFQCSRASTLDAFILENICNKNFNKMSYYIEKDAQCFFKV